MRAGAEMLESGNTGGYVVHEGCDHIFFVGFLGAGKSTVARNLSALFGRPYVDTDRLVELSCHDSVAGIFGAGGEEAFRDAETRVLRGLGRRKSLLVSCGGGIVEREENRRLMARMGSVVFLDGRLDDSLRQIRSLARRPELASPEEARRLYERRRPQYEAVADVSVRITGKTFDEVAQEAGRVLWERGLL